MSEKEEEIGTLGLIFENLFISYEKASEKIKGAYPRIKEEVKRKIRRLFQILVILFFTGVTLIAIGIHSENGTLLGFGRLILLPVVFVLFAIAALPALAFESIGAGKLTGQKYTTFVRHFFAYQLFLNLILMLPWVRINYQLYFYLMVAMFTLTFLTAWATDLGGLKFATSGIIIAIIGSLVVPGVSKMLSRTVGDFNKQTGSARLKRFTLDELLSDKVNFYSEGKPDTWICLDDEGKYVLYEDEAFCNNNGNKMQPINERVRKEMKKYKEKIISPLCLISSNNSPPAPATAPPTPSSSIVAIPAPTQPSAPDPPAPSSYQPPVDSRKEFAVIAVDNHLRPDRQSGEAMVNWLGNYRAIFAMWMWNMPHENRFPKLPKRSCMSFIATVLTEKNRASNIVQLPPVSK
jgi:hypothetical protein